MTPPPHKLRILMLHGYTQSGELFHAKTKALEKSLRKVFTPTGGLELVYPTAPVKIQPADIPDFSGNNQKASGNDEPGVSSSQHATDNSAPKQELADSFGWWIRRGEAEPFTYEGMETGLQKVAEVLRHEGPFDGVMGFSQGGSLAGMVASLLESGRREAFDKLEGGSVESIDETREGEDAGLDAAGKRRGGKGGGGGGGMPYPKSFLSQPQADRNDVGIHPPLRFAISYSGFGASTSRLYSAFYTPQIVTPMLHFLGSVDTVVEEARSLRLVDACAGNDREAQRKKRLIYHPGGHFLPSSQIYVNAVAGFIKEIMGWDGISRGDGRNTSHAHESGAKAQSARGQGEHISERAFDLPIRQKNRQPKEEEDERVEDMKVPF